MPAKVLALVVDIRILGAQSLKDRRAVVRTLCDGARNRFAVAAADVGVQDRWQRAQLAFVTVGSDGNVVAQVIDSVERFVWSFPELEVLEAERQWMDWEG